MDTFLVIATALNEESTSKFKANDTGFAAKTAQPCERFDELKEKAIAETVDIVLLNI